MESRAFNIRHLRAFCEVAKSGNIVQATKSVHLSQPAITNAILKLEKELGTLLFSRNSRGMIVTEIGTVFYGRVNRALEFLRTGAKLTLAKCQRTAKKKNQEIDHLFTAAQLNALVAVSKFENFTLAAQELGITQPSISRSARELENLTGVRLFRNTPQGMELTPAGQILAQSSRLAFSELRQGIEEIEAKLGSDKAKLFIGTLPLARTIILPTAINKFLTVRPDVMIRIVDGPYDDLLYSLRNGELDFLIGALRDPIPIDDVEQELLFNDKLAIVARNDHPLSGKKKISVRDLSRFPWIVPRPGTPTRRHFEAIFRQAKLEVPSNIVETSSLILVRGILLNSDRLTIISSHQIQHLEIQDNIRRLPINLDHTSRPIGLTMRKNWLPTETQSNLINFIRDASSAFF